LATYAFNQSAAKTALELVVVVTRKDLWRQRRKSNLDYLNTLYGDKPVSEQSSREKFAKTITKTDAFYLL